jgi:hypothetical protein
MYALVDAIKRGHLKEFNISSWNQMVIHVFGNKNQGRKSIYRGKEGLYLAKKKLLDYYQTQGKIPTSKTKGMRNIVAAFEKNFWVDYNINTWLDLKKATFQKEKPKLIKFM